MISGMEVYIADAHHVRAFTARGARLLFLHTLPKINLEADKRLYIEDSNDNLEEFTHS